MSEAVDFYDGDLGNDPDAMRKRVNNGRTAEMVLVSKAAWSAAGQTSDYRLRIERAKARIAQAHLIALYPDVVFPRTLEDVLWDALSALTAPVLKDADRMRRVTANSPEFAEALENHKVTPRKFERMLRVAALISAGESMVDVGHALGVSPHTVRNSLVLLRKIVGVESVRDLVLVLRAHGYVAEPADGEDDPWAAIEPIGFGETEALDGLGRVDGICKQEIEVSEEDRDSMLVLLEDGEEDDFSPLDNFLLIESGLSDRPAFGIPLDLSEDETVA